MYQVARRDRSIGRIARRLRPFTLAVQDSEVMLRHLQLNPGVWRKLVHRGPEYAAAHIVLDGAFGADRRAWSSVFAVRGDWDVGFSTMFESEGWCGEETATLQAAQSLCQGRAVTSPSWAHVLPAQFDALLDASRQTRAVHLVRSVTIDTPCAPREYAGSADGALRSP